MFIDAQNRGNRDAAFIEAACDMTWLFADDNGLSLDDSEPMYCFIVGTNGEVLE